MPTENSELVTFGGTSQNAVSFRGTRLTPSTFQQQYQGFRTGPGADRASLTDLTKAKWSDFSGGLDPTPGIKSWLQSLNRFRYNEGWQTRLPGLMVLPYDLVNQIAVTNDESLASAVAANWRAHVVMTSLGDTESRIYIAIGHKVFRNVGNGNSALEVCHTTTDVITAMRVLNVAGTPRLSVAANGATNDIFYVADPTGTWAGNTTVLVALSAGDYITAMDYFPTLGTGANIMVGEIGGVRGLWWQDVTEAAPWTMRPVVLTATKDQDAGGTASNTGTVNPAVGWVVPGSGNTTNIGVTNEQSVGFDTVEGTITAAIALTHSHFDPWAGASNILASDDADASCAYTHAFAEDSDSPGDATVEVRYQGSFGQLTDILVGGGFDLPLPDAAIITGIVAEAEVAEAADADDIVWFRAQLVLNGNLVGENRADGSEPTTTDAYKSYGGTTDRWGLELLGKDINAGQLGFGIQFMSDPDDTLSAAGSGTITVDHVRITVYYRELGSTLAFTNGGWMVTPNPAFPNRMAIVVPATKDDAAAITEPRVMWFIDYEWQADQARPTFTFSRPNTGLANVHHANPFQGGWSVTGNNSAGAGISLKHVDASGNLRDFAFPAHNGVEPYRINAIMTQGAWMILDCVANDFGDRQWWLYNNGRYFPDTILQSLSDGLNIAAQPIPFSTTGIDLQNDIIYSIFPNGTDAGVARQFLPSDLGVDPRLVNLDKTRTQATTTVDEDTRLLLQSVELDIGPEEANKAMLVLEYLGRRISAATGAAYGSVEASIVTDADTTFASPDVTHAFTTAFEQYDIPSAGVTYRSVILQIGGNHDADSVDSPDGLPILLTTAQDWPHERTYIFELNELIAPDNIFDFMDRLEALAAERVTQPLDMSHIPNQPAKFDRYLIPNEGFVLPPRGAQPAPAHFINMNGEEVFIGLQFHTVPGTGDA